MGDIIVVGHAGLKHHLTPAQFEEWSKSMDHYTVLYQYWQGNGGQP